MIESLLNLFFGCRHACMSRPFSAAGGPVYVVCLSGCGKRFLYDGETGKTGVPIERAA